MGVKLHCSRGEKEEKEGRESLLCPVSSRFIFVFALSQFSGPNYLGAWNMLCSPANANLFLVIASLHPREATTGNSLRSQAARNRNSTACKTSDISFSAHFAGFLKAGPTESFLYE